MKLQSLHSRRRGVVLMVVLAMLTLFAVVGLTFVTYSESQATQAQNQKLGETVKLPDSDLVFNYIMRQLVYGTADNRSALYTHSLLADMYGISTAATPVNKIPFSGSGRFGVNDPNLGNNNAKYYPNFQGRTYDENTYGSLNPPYTYPDHNHVYLGAWTNTSNGNEVVARSFVRDAVIRLDLVLTGAPNEAAFVNFAFNPYDLTDPVIRKFWNWDVAAVGGIYGFDLPIPPPPPGRTYVLGPATGVIYDVGGGNFVRRFIVATPVTTILPQHAADRQILRAMVMRPGPWDHFIADASGVRSTFPPPADLGGDVKNLTPDMKSVVTYTGAGPIYGGADSIWMDIGFPTISAPGGRKLKPLAAFYITDLDNKVNVNVAGNQRGRLENTAPPPGPGTYHTSANGIGPFEINPEAVLPIAELRNLFAGNTIARNSSNQPLQVEYPRYNYVDPVAAGVPPELRDPASLTANYSSFWHSSHYAPLLRSAPFYSQYDLDGTVDGNGPSPLTYVATNRYVLNNSLVSRFPQNNGPNQGYGSGANTEFMRGGLQRSPLFNSPFGPDAGNPRGFSAQNLEAMFRFGDTGADALTSELRRILPTSFTSSGVLHRLTTSSFDLNRTPAAPWISNYGDNLKRFVFNDGIDRFRPIGQNASGPANPTATNGEYYPPPPPPGFPPSQPTWRSVLAMLPRIDLNRPLPHYPMPPNPSSLIDTTNPNIQNAVNQAILARQDLARDIFHRLVLSTNALGARELAVSVAYGVSLNVALGTPQEENALRWLAQLSVNIVDYIDNDDYMTPFDWNSALNRGAGVDWVFGTELPRLLFNEVYLEAVQGSSAGNLATGDYGAKHWVELYNPLMNQGFANHWPDGPNVRFSIGSNSAATNTAVYQLIVTRQTNVDAGLANNIRNHNNNLGMDLDQTLTAPNRVVIQLNGLPPPTTGGPNRLNGDVTPIDDSYNRPASAFPVTDANYSVPGFYLIGPENFATTSVNPGPIPVDETINQLNLQNRFSHTAPNDAAANSVLARDENRQAILLQRLACPYLPAQPNPTLPLYNPYITIDYVEKLQASNAIQFSSTGPNSDLQQPNERASVGKIQPFAGQFRMWRKSDPTAASPDSPKNTFLRHNGRDAAAANPGTYNSPSTETLKTPFDWLVHLDRALLSPAELLHVSGYKPHELTQQFITTSSGMPSLYSPFRLPIAVAPGQNPIPLPPPQTARGSMAGLPWTMQANDLLLVEPGTPQEEWVRVESVGLPGYDSFTATFSQNHAANAVICPLVAHGQSAPWFTVGAANFVFPGYDESRFRIYRFLDMVATRNPQVHMSQGRMFISNVAANTPNPGQYTIAINPVDPNTGLPALTPSSLPTLSPNGTLVDIQPGTVLAYNSGAQYVRVLDIPNNPDKNNNTLILAFATAPVVGGTLDFTFHGGRQPGRINLNTVFDPIVFGALLDRQNINIFSVNDVAKEFDRLQVARQPNLFSSATRPRIGGLQNISLGFPPINVVVEDKPILPLTAGDYGSTTGIQDTALRPFSTDTPGENGASSPRRDNRNRLFETEFREAAGFAFVSNPFERFDVFSKLFNNTTTRSNVFAVWLTVGFFEVDDAGVLGAEVGQLDGRNTRYRFFAIVDRSALEEWFQAMNALGDTSVHLNNLINATSIDPRYFSDVNPAAICTDFSNLVIPGNPGVRRLELTGNYTPYLAGQMVQVTGYDNGGNLLRETVQLLPAAEAMPAPNWRYARLRFGTQYAPGSHLVVKQIPVPPTILHWSQIK